MDLILNEEDFDDNEIIIKHCKNSQKILYHKNGIYLIGIPFKIKNFTIVQQTNKYLTIDISKTKQYDVFKKIDDFFQSKYKSKYRHFLNKKNLRIKKNNSNNYNEENDVYITINNIKYKNSFVTIQLFTV
tara:strand:+ start:143 stop:532 length:390 start_codon:yes stop_codon:yes gene_type:complete